MEKYHTVVVVGGGPAGSSTAYTLAKHGIDVCIVDKASFPRNKLCGGLLTIRSKKIFSQIFDASWNDAYEYSATGMKFFFKDQHLKSVENYSELFFTRRIDFDALLLRMAESEGVAMYLGDGIVAINLEKKVCRLRSGNTLSYKYLVGSDGVNSVVSKALYGASFNKRTIGFALEIEVERSDVKREISIPEVYFGVARWGYGWVFPKTNTLTVGIGGLHAKNKCIKAAFDDFLQTLFGEIPSGKINGHYIPFGDYRKRPGSGNVLLAGDATGLVDPITGEGIAFAMQSGYFVALSILQKESSDMGVSALEIYKEKYLEISNALNCANKLRYLIFPKPSEYLFTKILPRAGSLPRKHMDLMADNITYEEYAKYLSVKILKGIARRAFFLK